MGIDLISQREREKSEGGRREENKCYHGCVCDDLRGGGC